jgi:hypothetical protein
MGVVTRQSKGVVMSATHKHSRELASRHSHGLAVALRWYPLDDRVTVAVADTRTGDRLEFAVDRARALDAFYHPYAYAA